MKKKHILLLASLTLVVLIALWHWQTEPAKMAATKDQAHKKQGRAIASIALSHKEKSALKHQEKNLTIARDPQWLIRENRVVTGNVDEKIWRDPHARIDMLNRAGDWQKPLTEQLLRYQPEEITLTIRPIESYILGAQDKGRYVEEVLVSYLKDEKFLSSYRAMVDSQTGEVIKTWSRTVSENLKKSYPRLNPGGP